MISGKGGKGGYPISDFFLTRGKGGKPISGFWLTSGGGEDGSPTFLADIQPLMVTSAATPSAPLSIANCSFTGLPLSCTWLTVNSPR